jgi:hypothetical protein
MKAESLTEALRVPPVASGYVFRAGRTRLPRHLLLVGRRASAARRTLAAIPKLTNVDLKLSDRAAEGVAVHVQFARGAALVALVLLQHGQDELLLELANRFRVENIAFVHLHDEGFELILHGISLSS